ncbi:MAG: TolC family outer membrane protein [Burkholderiales bacterium]|nr:TolC family outer membrane protein [Burkholderiales bacterium]
MRLKLIACLVGVVACGTASAEDLMSVYRDALVQDPVYAAERAAYQATKERRVQARALLLPNINATGNIGYNYSDTSFGSLPAETAAFASRSEGGRDYETWGAGINASQPLYRPQDRVFSEQAALQVTQAESQVARAGQDLMLRVAQAYFDVLLAQYELTTVEAQKAATAEQLAQAKRNFEVGTATITDTYDAQARYDLTVANELRARNDIEVRIRSLLQLIGRMPGPLAQLTSTPTLNAPLPNDMEKWVEAAFSTSPDIATARSALDIAVKEVERNRLGHHPAVDAVAGLNYNRAGASSFGDSVSQSTNTATVGVQVAVPLYQGGAISSRVREAIANRTRAEQDLENTRRTVAQTTRQAFLAVNTGLSEINALLQAVASNQLSVEASKLGQEVGVRTQVDVLNAQDLLYQAQRNLARAYYVAILSQLRLKASVGRLTEADLENVNRLLVQSK